MAEEEKKYGAITLDTNVFIFAKGKIDITHDLIKSMEQFKTNSGDHVEFILSEIVYEEILSDLKSAIKESKNNFKELEKSLRRNKLINDRQRKELENFYESFSLDTKAESIINSFQRRTNCTVVKFKNITIDDIFKKYFQCHPPFIEKKKEFPDAVALMSLEQWAKLNNTFILAVSSDKDWLRYAEKTEWIDIEKNLGQALDKFQQQKEESKKYIVDVLSRIEQEPHNYHDSIASLIEKINDNLNEIDINLATDLDRTDWHAEGEIRDIECRDISFDFDEDFSLIRVKGQELTFLLPVEIDVVVNSTFDLYGNYEEDIVLGTVDDEMNTKFKVEILVTMRKHKFEGNTLDSITFTDVRITTIPELYFNNLYSYLLEMFGDPTYEKY